MSRFYLDENFNFKVADPLIRLGHIVITPDDLGARHCWDDEQFFIAVQQRATFVSFNVKDMRLLHAAWYSWSRHWGLDKPHCGAIILQQPRPAWSPEYFAQELHNVVTRFDMENQAVEWRPSRGWTYVTPYRLLSDLDVTTET